MSGHSHARTIKHQKELTDQKRGQVFSKMARVISLAVKEGGQNPETNNKLKVAMEQAKQFNMPRGNIERAIKQVTDKGEGANLIEVVFEAYGPGGVAIIIEGITDNKNRTLGEIKQTLSQHQGKLVAEGAIKWMFERRGTIMVDIKNRLEQTAKNLPNIKNEELELKAIESGAEDYYWRNDYLEIYTKAENLEKVKQGLKDKKIKIESASLDWIAKERVAVGEKEKELCQKLFEALDENEAVQEIYSNIKLP